MVGVGTAPYCSEAIKRWHSECGGEVAVASAADCFAFEVGKQLLC